jgi:hypothetical protein
MPIGNNQIKVDSPSPAQVLRASQAHPSLSSSAQARSANTSLFPARSTPNAVKMMVESAFSPCRMLKCTPSRYTIRQCS